MIEYYALNAGRDRAFIGSGGNRPRPSALTPTEQIELLRPLDLPQSLNLPTSTIVIPHGDALTRSDANEAKRHGTSNAHCQAELLIQSLVYESAPGVARSLRVTATFQLFDTNQAIPVFRFASSAKARLKFFPAKRPEDVPAANADLENAYRNAVQTFAAYANRARLGSK